MSSVKFWWLGFGLLTVAALVGSNFGQWIRLGQATPDLLLIVLVWFAIDLSLWSALTLGVVASFLKMATSGEPSLLILLSLMTVSGLSNWCARQLVKEILWVQLGLLGILCLIVDTSSLVWIHSFDSMAELIGFFFSHVLSTTLYTVIVAPWIWQRLNKISIRCGWDWSTKSIY